MAPSARQLHGHQVSAEDGAVRITRIEAEKGAGCIVGLASLWTAASAYLLIAQLGVLPVSWDRTWRQGEQAPETHVGYWTPTALGLAMFGGFLLLGLGSLYAALESRYSRRNGPRSATCCRSRSGCSD